MKKKQPKGGNNVEKVNLLAPDFNILPPKLPQKTKGESKLLQVRIIPGYSFDENGKAQENSQLDPQAFQEGLLGEDLLGNWACAALCLSVEHWNAATGEKSYSWLSGEVLQDNGSGEDEFVKSPAVVAGWKWFNELKEYSDRSRYLFNEENLPGKQVAQKLKEEFDMQSIRPVENAVPFPAIFVQVVPMMLGSDELPLSVWGKTLLPVQKASIKKELIKVLTNVADEYEGQELSVETSVIGDITSLENGSSIGIKQKGTVAEISRKVQKPLNPEFINPDNDYWRPWDPEDSGDSPCVFPWQNPQEIVNQLIKVTSPNAVDWALRDSEWQNLIPEKIKGAGDRFSLKPLSKIMESMSNEDISPPVQPEAFTGEKNTENEEQNPIAPPPSPEQKAETKESIKPDPDTQVSPDADDKFSEIQKNLNQQHDQTTK